MIDKVTMRTFINTLCLIVILLLLITFAVKNSHPVDLNYYGLVFSCSAYLLVLVPFFIGVLCGNLFDVVKRFKLKHEIKRLRKELEKAEQADFQ
ncbi:MAG: LapA family protein [Proteobacteria bacterium]|nr:LapA family protein [Pseudomonadota bacterium]